MEKENTIKDYVINCELDIENMINDFSGFIHTVIENNAKSILSVQDKEEILSDVFLTVWRNKKIIDENKPLKYYMAGIAKNLIKNRLRKQKRDSKWIEFNEQELQDLNDIEIICEQRQIMEAIARELNNMKPKDYKIFSKYYYYSKSEKEIAKELGISENNVSVKLYRIKKKLKRNLEKRGIKYKEILSIILVIFLLTGVVFGRKIVKHVEKIFTKEKASEITTKGVERAKEEGYVYKLKEEYDQKQELKKDNGVEINIESILMDDYNLEIVFEIKLDDSIEINLNDTPAGKEISNFNFLDFIITDEENNVILANFLGPKSYREFCEENGIEMNGRNIAIANGSENYDLEKKDEHTYKWTFKCYSNNFPKSKSLNIKIGTVRIFVRYAGAVLDNIEGNWNMNVELPKTFYDRETIKYEVRECNKEDTIVKNVEVSQTGTKIELETRWGEPIYNKWDNILIKNNKLSEWLDSYKEGEYVSNEYILTEENEKYYTTRLNEGDTLINIGPDGIMKYYQTFDLTTFDATDELIVVLPTGNELKKNSGLDEIIIKLKKTEDN